jgi:hypothetical protein
MAGYPLNPINVQLLHLPLFHYVDHFPQCLGLGPEKVWAVSESDSVNVKLKEKRLN